MKTIYLDNNTTTAVSNEVLDAMMPYFRQEYGNPSSLYDLGTKANQAIKNACGQIKEFLNAKDAREIYFTSSGSESANMAIRGVLNSDKTKNT